MLPSIFGESLFDDWMGFPFRSFGSDVDRKLYGKHAAHVMRTDLKEHDEGYELKVDLPGFKKDQIDLQLQNGYLTITASKGLEEEGKEKARAAQIAPHALKLSTLCRQLEPGEYPAPFSYWRKPCRYELTKYTKFVHRILALSA